MTSPVNGTWALAHRAGIQPRTRARTAHPFFQPVGGFTDQVVGKHREPMLKKAVESVIVTTML